MRGHKCYIWNSLSHPVRFKGWGHNRGKGVTHELSPCLLEGPRYLGHGDMDGMKGLEKPTLGRHGVHAELLA